MAKSPAHKLGQIIGDEIEAAISAPLREIAEEFGLFLDHQHGRSARGGKRKVAWEDSYGNTHDLDYVLEEGGSDQDVGQPRAFIEVAWRRYTKHSRNKVQEIQGAVLPLVEKYGDYSPFFGAILAGDFTEGARGQLLSHGFHVAYAGYEVIKRAFARAGVDVGSDETTAATDLRGKVKAYERLVPAMRNKISAELHAALADELGPFFEALRESLERRIAQITVLALSGTPVQFHTIQRAVRFIESYDESMSPARFVRYELNVRYSNGSEVRGSFPDKRRCLEHLHLLSRG